MVAREIEVTNKLGLHARAASKFATLANEFSSSIRVGYSGRSIDGKSIMSLMLLAAAKGSILTLEAEGKDELAAIDALATLINDRFGEGE